LANIYAIRLWPKVRAQKKSVTPTICGDPAAQQTIRPHIGLVDTTSNHNDNQVTGAVDDFKIVLPGRRWA
jgi:hypothetical protein